MIDTQLYKPIILVSCAVWIGFLFLYVAIWLLEGGLPPDLLHRTIIYTASTALNVLAGIAMFAVLKANMMLRWPIIFLLALVTLLLHSGLGAMVYILLTPTLTADVQSFLPLFLTAMINDSPIVSSAFIGFIAIHYGQQLMAQQRLLLEQSNAARDAQLATLRHQLNPHFLFNTLNSISALVTEGETEDAERTILLLSEFLRSSLEADAIALIPLEEELESVRKYLQIEQVRYEDRLNITTQIDNDARDWRVPPFMLQPLLENVIKHAVSKVGRPVSVNIFCWTEKGTLTVIVEDDGPGLTARAGGGPGMGLQNLEKRLHLIYGAHARFETLPVSPNGLRAVITIARQTTMKTNPDMKRSGHA